MKMPGSRTTPEDEEHLMGVVTRVAGSSLTVILEKGSSAVVVTNAGTSFERGDAKAGLKDIKAGERIVIYATAKDGRWLARVVKLGATGPRDRPDVKLPEPHADEAADAGVPSAHDKGMKMSDQKPPQQVQEYTCPMHPEVRSEAPGKCPKCGMKLQPVGGQ